VETSRIAKRLVKNCWTKHGLPYCMQKIEEENWVSSATLSLGVDLCVSLSNYLFLTSPRLMKISEVVIEGVEITGDCAQVEISVRGASATGTVGNNAETEAPGTDVAVAPEV
jgi:hypothetical protein